MKQKLAVMLLAAGMAFSCTFAFTACNDTPTADNGGDPVITPGDDDSDTPTTPGDDDTPTTPDEDEQHEHTYTSEVTTQPTCTQEGVMTYTCTCGDSYTEAIPTIAHTYVDGVCTVCGTPEPQPTEGLEFTLTDDGTQYSVTGYTGSETEVTITSTYKGLPVTGIGMQTFMWREELTSVTIPDSVTSIGGSAFQDCSSLTNIAIPASVTSIGYEAFALCSSLTSIIIPDSVTSIGGRAFWGCIQLTNIVIPDNVIIGEQAFNETGYYYDQSNWENGFAGVLYLGNHLIFASTSLSDAYIIRNGTKTIAASAFQYCRNLSSITIPYGVTSIGELSFQYCSNLTSVTIPDSVTSIGGYAFQDCWNLTSITIPNSVTSIGGYAFLTCGFTSITIPDSVTSIGSGAFSGCSNLASVTFENTEGWSVEGWDGQINNIDVTDPAQNAVYLTDTYLWNNWTRGE